jgi:putative photosynthetic complex assembly protein 2
LQLTLGTIVYAAFLWWFSTGVIFYLNARSPRTFRWSMLAGSLLGLAAVYGLWATAGSDSVSAAFVGFTCGLAIWGWHTMSYYMGVVTGPRRAACPEGCSGTRRFAHALMTSLYHELAIVATVAALIWLTWGQPNPVGLWTFLLLWAMHVSAKLNVFLGVRNLNAEFIPERLAYLTTYFRERPMNLLFPFSVTAGTVVTVMLALQAGAPGVSQMTATSFVLLASLAALAVIEHWFMVLPIPAEALWRWSLQHRSGEGPTRSTHPARPRPAKAAAKEAAQSDSRKMASAPASSASA